MSYRLTIAACVAAVSFAACSGTNSTSTLPLPFQGVRANQATTAKKIEPAKSVSYIDTVKGNSPIAFYPMYETRLNDVSGNAHTGVLNGTVATKQPGLLSSIADSNSMSFATGYGTETATWTAQAVTAEAWIRPTAADLAGSPRILDNAWTDHDGNGFMLWITNGTIAFNTGWLADVDTAPLVAGQAYHVVGTYTAGAGATLYVNGSPVANKLPGAIPNPQTGDTSTTYIGVLNASAGGFGFTDYFQGDISDVALYDHALTAAQIANDYNVGTSSDVQPTPLPTASAAPTAPPPTPEPTKLSYNASTACVFGKQYTNDVMPAGEGEFGTNGLDRTYWGRKRGNNIGGNQYSGFQVSWGRNQYDTYFGDANDGISYPSDDPFYVGQDTAAPGSPQGVRIMAEAMPAHLVGNPQVNGANWYSGVLDNPVDQQYGFFVARIRTPAPNPGMSPAYWLLSNNGMPQGQHGPLNGEWDVQEMFGADEGNGMNSGTLVWNSASSSAQNWGGAFNWAPPGEPADPTPSQDYHDWGVLIQPGGASISPNDYGSGGPGPIYGPSNVGVTDYLDGVPIYGHTGGADVTQGVAWKEMMAMFQVAPQGSWLGNPNPANFPAYYWIQWERVYRPTSSSC